MENKGIKVKIIVLILTATLSGCGGSEEFTPAQATTSIGGKQITINENYSVIVKTPSEKDSVTINGSNNSITIMTKPKDVNINGNDNHIELKKPLDTQTKGEGTQ